MSSPHVREHSVWPKLPFPPHYSWREIKKRADAVCQSDAYRSMCIECGPSVLADGYMHVTRATEARQEKFFEMPWQPGRRDDRFLPEEKYRVMLPLTKPAEVVLLVGVAGAEDGSGGPTVQRFVLTLGLFASFSIILGGEDSLTLHVVAKNAHAAHLIAERACQIAPKLENSESLVRSILDEQRLTLWW